MSDEKGLIVKEQENKVSVKSAFANFINGITRIFTEREDLFNALDEIGIEWSSSTTKLIKRKGRIKDTESYALQELVNEMVKNRERRHKEIQKNYINNVKTIRKAESNAKNQAIKSVKDDIKIKRKKLEFEFGFIKGRKEFKEKRKSYNFGESLEQQVKYYMEKANIPELERMVEESRYTYDFETRCFISVLQNLSKRIRNQNMKQVISNAIETIDRKKIND